jgi:uncharacterized protein YndB with AHSA1/START domain
MVAKNSPVLTVTLPSDREIVMTRSFRARRRLVFEAMTKREHIPNWWGPRGSTLATCESDLRVGGAWRFVERGADGSLHPFNGEWRDVTPPERLALTQIYDVEPFADKEVLVTVVLSERDGETLMTNTMSFASKEDRDGMLVSGMERGAGESYDRLDELLARLTVTG